MINYSLFKPCYQLMFLLQVFPATGMVLGGINACSGQEKKIQARIENIEKRLDAIEQTLARIENVLFATIKYSESEARKQLKETKAALAQTERLHAQGLISAAQLRLDRMSLDRAETLLKMCGNHTDYRRIGATLDVLDAKQDYERKKLQLQHTREMVDRGLGAKGQIGLDQSAVLLAGQKLKLAETRLKNLVDPARKKEPKPR